jgi:hypothetical protein
LQKDCASSEPRHQVSGIRYQVVLKKNLVYHDERLPVRDAALSI